MWKFKTAPKERGILVDRGLVYYRVYYKGKQIQKCFGRAEFGNSFRSAVQALKQLRRELKLQKLREKPTQRVTVPQGIKIYLRRYAVNKNSSRDAQRVQNYLAPVGRYFGDRYLDTIMTEDILAYRQSREGQVSRSTINTEHGQFRRAIAHLLKWSLAGEIPPITLTQRNPAEVVKIPWLKEDHKGGRIPAGKLDLLLQSAPSPLREIVLEAVKTGKTRDQLLGEFNYPFGTFRLEWPVALQKAGLTNLELRFTYLKRLKGLLSQLPIAHDPGNPAAVHP